MNLPLISVIVPVYNVEKYLKRCVLSIQNQSYRNLEIILVDDGSTDSSPELCDRFAENDDRILVLHKVNGGLSSARNAGMDNMTGEYFTFVDSDDFVHADYVAYLYQIAEEQDCGLVQVGYIAGTDESFPPENKSEKRQYFDKYTWADGVDLTSIACGKLYAKNVANGVRFPVGKIYEDDGTYYKFAYNSRKICVSNRQLYYYYQRMDSIMQTAATNTDFIDIYNERIAYFEEKEEEFLLRKSYERYALVLITYYRQFLRQGAERSKLESLKSRFDEIYPMALKSNVLKHKLLLSVFRRSPRLALFLLGLKRK